MSQSPKKLPSLSNRSYKSRRSMSTSDANVQQRSYSKTPSISPKKQQSINQSRFLRNSSIKVQVVEYERGNQNGFKDLQDRIQYIIQKQNNFSQQQKKDFEQENAEMINLLSQMNGLLTKKLDKRIYFNDTKRNMGYMNTNSNRDLEVDLRQNDIILKQQTVNLQNMEKRELRYKNANSIEIMEKMHSYTQKIKETKLEISKIKTLLHQQKQTKEYQNVDSGSQLQNTIDQVFMKQKSMQDKLEGVREKQKKKLKVIKELEEQLQEVQPKIDLRGKELDEEIARIQSQVVKIKQDRSYMEDTQEKKNQQCKMLQKKLVKKVNKISQQYNELKPKIQGQRKKKKEIKKDVIDLMKETNKNKSEFLKEFKGDQYNEEDDREQNKNIHKIQEDRDEDQLSEMSLLDEEGDMQEEEQEEEEEEQSQVQQKQQQQSQKQNNRQQQQQQQQEEEEQEDEEQYDDEEYEQEEEEEEQQENQKQQNNNSDIDLDDEEF